MNHITRFEVISSCYFGFSRAAASEGSAFRKKSRTCRPVYGSVYASSTEEAVIRRVYYSVTVKRGYVALFCLYYAHGPLLSYSAGQVISTIFSII